MNILLWIIQGMLALLCVAGGATKVFKIDDLLKQPAMSALPKAVWQLLGVVEVIAGLLLIVPGAAGLMPALTPIAAGVLAAENILISVLYARHSTKMVASNPLVWTLVMAIFAIIVIYGRCALSPFV